MSSSIPIGVIARALAGVFPVQPKAEMILTQIGYPIQHAPRWDNAMSYWTQVVQDLEAGRLKNGVLSLVDWSAQEMPGATDLAELREKLRTELGLVAEPTSRSSAPPLTADGQYPTVVMSNSDRHQPFLRLMEEQLGVENVDLLYASARQSAVHVPAQDDEGELMIDRLEPLVRQACGETAELHYEETPFRGYLFRELVVVAPDGTPYTLHLVPATTTAEVIASAIVQQRPEAMTHSDGRRVRTVVDHITGDHGETHRLEPGESLHEAGVRDGDRLQVGTQAIAGAISPVLHTDAVYRARAQINRFAAAHREVAFVVESAEPPEVPTKYVVAFDLPGFAPPEDFSADPLEPQQIGHHKVHILLPRDFPVAAPVVVWKTAVFHPNIWQNAATGAIPGQACLGQLMDGWRPDMKLGLLCRLIMDIGCFKNYDVTEATTFPDPLAARWARSEQGQSLIGGIGGKLIAEARPAQSADEPVNALVEALWVEQTRGNQ